MLLSDEMDGLYENASIEEQCLEMGKILGLNGPVSRAVFLAAVEDEVYAHNLLACRRDSQFMSYLLNNPPPIKNDCVSVSAGEISNIKLVKRATKSLWRWSKTGFSVVDDETLDRRERACLSCPHLSDPVRGLQGILTSKEAADRLGERVGGKVCGICGCDASGKIRKTSATCPDKHPSLLGMTRWGEAVQEKT